ncbi:hypothetical protein [Micromonospora sp. NBS 11-29]|nr:hypothetical protein [Micromonospora sp. NBS 11-29]
MARLPVLISNTRFARSTVWLRVALASTVGAGPTVLSRGRR